MNHYISGIIKIILLEASIALLIIDRVTGDRHERAKRFAFAGLAGLMIFAWANYGSLRQGSSWTYTMLGYPLVFLVAWLVAAGFRKPEDVTARQLTFRDGSRSFAEVVGLKKLKTPHRVFAATIAGFLTLGWVWWGVQSEAMPLVHQWEQFHFYLGAKYQKEVGWFDLYKAALIADREGPNTMAGVTVTRKLETFDDIPVSEALQDAPRVKQQFSPERWEEFRADWLRMARSWSASQLEAESLPISASSAPSEAMEGASGGGIRRVSKTGPAGTVLRVSSLDQGLLGLGEVTSSLRLAVSDPSERIATARCTALRKGNVMEVGHSAVETKEWKSGEWKNVDVVCGWRPDDAEQTVELVDYVPGKTDVFIDSVRFVPANAIDWGRIVDDHGNSNSPAWSIIAHPITRLVSLTPKHQAALGWLDMVLMLVMWLFVYETFGRKVAGVGLFMWAVPPLVFDYLSGSLLRWDWLFAIGMAACFMKRERWGTAGAFFGYAVATKLFPMFFGIALLLRALEDVRNRGSVKREYVQFAKGTVAAGLACVVIAAGLFGADAWSKYAQRIEVAQTEKYYSIQYSLKTVFLQAVAPGDPILAEGIFPRAIKQEDRNVRIEDYTLGFTLARLAFTLLIFLLIRRATDLEAFLLGPLLVFTWLTVNMYYWNMLGFVAMGLATRKQRFALPMLIGLQVIFMVYYLYQHMNRGFSEGYAVGLLMCLWIAAAAIWEWTDSAAPDQVASAAEQKQPNDQATEPAAPSATES